MLKTRVFWLLFVMMTILATSGLMVISQMGAFARDFGVANVAVVGTTALPKANLPVENSWLPCRNAKLHRGTAASQIN
jgi:hypothetical protein